MKIFWISSLLLFLISNAKPQTQNFDRRMNALLAEVDQSMISVRITDIVKDLAMQIMESRYRRIAFIPFINENGRRSALTEYLQTEFKKALQKDGMFSGIQFAIDVLNEKRVSQFRSITLSGACLQIVDQEKYQCLVQGTVSMEEDNIFLWIRACKVGSGKLLFEQHVLLPATGALKRLNQLMISKKDLGAEKKKTLTPQISGTDLKQPALPSSVSRKPVLQQEKQEASSRQAKKSGFIYYEDFNGVKEGYLPRNWLGGDKLMVKTDGRRKFVTDFGYQNEHQVIIENLKFPENFEFGVLFQFGGNLSGTHFYIDIGSVKTVIDVYGWYKLNDTIIETRTNYRWKVIKAAIRKKGLVFELFINGRKMITRRERNFQLPNAVTLKTQNMGNFKILRVWLKEL